jgi:non-specific serine/threonine protein kinase
MSPEQILARLTDRYALLTRGNRSAPSRQQTLRMCIDWSYDLCTPMEQKVWAQLSVFAGGFELDAAEEVCDADPAADELLDTVTFLVDKSILTREAVGATVRFRMLEILRDYGREKAQEAGEYPDLRRRHREYYERLALEAEADWISSRQLEWITGLGRGQPNLREALEFCSSDNPHTGLRITAALFPFWLSRGLLSEGRHWFDCLLTHLTGPLTVERAKAFYADSILAGLQGDLQVPTALVRQGRLLADQRTDPISRAHLDLAEGFLALFGGQLPDARAHLDEAVQVYAARGDLLCQVVALLGLGLTHDMLGEAERAIDCHERVLAITEPRGEVVYRSYTLWALAVAVWRHGDRARAIRLLEQSLQLNRGVNGRLNASLCLQALAWIAAEEHNSRLAAVLMGAAEELAWSVGSPVVVFPGLLEYQQECERQTRRALSDQAYAAAHREGAALGFSGAVAYALGEQLPPTPTSAADPTKRERQVAELVAEGLTNKEIAARLTISPRTAQGHVEHLLTKLGFTSRAQIAAWIVESQNKPS